MEASLSNNSSGTNLKHVAHRNPLLHHSLQSVNVFSGVANHASLFGSLMDKYGFGGRQENTTYQNAQCHQQFGGGELMG